MQKRHCSFRKIILKVDVFDALLKLSTIPNYHVCKSLAIFAPSNIKVDAMTVKDYFCKSDFEKVIPYLLKHGEKYRNSIFAFHDKPWSGIIGREVVIDEGIELDSIEHVTAFPLYVAFAEQG
jgi:hypothetical protein